MIDLRRYNYNNYAFIYEADLLPEELYILLNGRLLTDQYLIIEDERSQLFYSREIMNFAHKKYTQFPKNFTVYSFEILTINSMIRANKERINGFVIDPYEFSRHLLKQKLRRGDELCLNI